jgi:hypothetical protein
MADNHLSRKVFLVELGSLMVAYGFQQKPISQIFRRSERVGWAAIHVTLIRHATDAFDVTVDASVRYDSLQDELLGGDALISAADRKNSATLGCELGNWIGEGQVRWSVQTPEDAKAVAKRVATSVAEHLLPFIARFSEPSELLRTLQEDGREARLIIPIKQFRERALEALLRNKALEGRL